MIKLNNKKASSRTQIKITQMLDNILVLPGNRYRLILETSSVNFELKSDEEQDSLTEIFRNFLNSLPSKIQILVRIREINIDSYVENLKKDNVFSKEVLEYSDFLKKLVSGNKIMTRKFYIVISLDGVYKNDFDLIKERLSVNAEIISKGLEKLGIKTKILSKIEAINLFYSVYNWNHIKSQPLNEFHIQDLYKKSYVATK